MKTNRRQFLNETFTACSTFGATAALLALGSRLAIGQAPSIGGLVPTLDENTGLPLLRLPAGFRYRSSGWSGDPMTDGTSTPSEHDAMGVVRADGDILTLVRNHEISDDGAALVSQVARPYDPQAQGGCCTLKFDSARGEWLDSWISLSGTSRNCAGGITPWNTWLSCEETVLGENSIDRYKGNVTRGFQREHGWIFEVDPMGVADPQPIKEMGRFVHEAVAIDHSGVVYETEDRDTASFYRFVPQTPGKLSDGGQLQVAEVVGQPDVRGGVSGEAVFDVVWHDIPDPMQAHSPGSDPPDELGVYKQGQALGATTFCASRVVGLEMVSFISTQPVEERPRQGRSGSTIPNSNSCRSCWKARTSGSSTCRTTFVSVPLADWCFAKTTIMASTNTHSEFSFSRKMANWNCSPRTTSN